MAGVGVRNLRRVCIVLGVCNALVFLSGGFLISQTYRLCDLRLLLPFLAVSVAAVFRILVMLQTAIAQQAAATLILDDHTSTDDLVLRLHRRARYKKWLWWSRCSVVVTVLQFLCATYLVLKSAYYFSNDTSASTDCLLGCIGMDL